MNKLCALFMSLMFSVAVFAQSHLEFRGIPIDGHINDFVKKMKAIGYVETHRTSSAVLMTGKFANHSATIGVFSTSKSHKVYNIAVTFEKQSSWSSIKSRYFEFKELYTSKYGKPSKVVERFKDPYYEGDGYEMQALKLDKCVYASIFDLPNGQVYLGMGSDTTVSLYYVDSKNEALNESEEKSSALDDI